MRLVKDASLLDRLSRAGQKEARQRFSVKAAAESLEAGFLGDAVTEEEKMVF